MSYFSRLTVQLAAGAQALPPELLERQAAWLCAAQRSDGGFSGRAGPSDVYYTSFGLRGLLLAGALSETRAQAVARFLAEWLQAKIAAAGSIEKPFAGSTGEYRGERGRADQPVVRISMPELAALVLSAATIETVCKGGVAKELAELDLTGLAAARLESLRRDDGGFAGTEHSRSASTYHTFLAVVCCRELEIPLAGEEAIVKLIRTRQRPDGGFAESLSARFSGTNPTAAAVAVLRSIGALSESIARGAADFLARMQAAEGGWRAHARIPLADLLSTFTALVALRDLEALEAVDLAAAERFVAALEHPGGGFCAVPIEQSADVEYTFYGLGSLALLRSHAANQRVEPSET